MWQLNVNQWIRCLFDESSDSYAWEHVTQENTVVIFQSSHIPFCWLLFSLLARTSNSWSLLAALCAPQSQYQDDHVVGPPLGEEGEAPWEVWGWRYVGCSWCTQAYSHSINYCTCIYTRAYLYCICRTLHDPSPHTVHQITKQGKIWLCNLSLNWHVTWELPLSITFTSSFFKEFQTCLCIPRMLMWA